MSVLQICLDLWQPVSACPTFLVSVVLLKADVAQMKDGSCHSKQVGLLLSSQSNLVHGLVQHPIVLCVMYGRVLQGGGV